jgi:Ala-tRNA(Pro) deacylase
MPGKKLSAFLDEQKIKYVAIRHSPRFTAQEIAASAHVPGQELAKTVVVKLEEELALAVLPASYRVDFELLREVSGAKWAELADEEEFRDRFPGCELGAMPPFGNLYGMQTFVADALAEDDEIAFNAGSHSELIRMSYADFERLVQPQVMHFAARAL